MDERDLKIRMEQMMYVVNYTFFDEPAEKHVFGWTPMLKFIKERYNLIEFGNFSVWVKL